MTRRRFGAIVFGLGLACAAGFTGAGAPAASTRLPAAMTVTAAGAAAAQPARLPVGRAPNILLIVADDLGYGDLGSYGQTRVRTPNLDRLAAQGVRFTQFYAGAPVCAPSRSVLMTGQHVGHTLIRGNGKIDLRPQDTTVAELLKKAGYSTGLVGKWGLGKEGSTGAPLAKGFDSFFGYIDQAHAHNYYPHFLVRNDARVPLRNVVPKPGPFGQGVATSKVEYSADLIADDAEAFIDRNRDKPFFLAFTPTLPHANNEAGVKGMEVPDYGAYANESWPEPQKGFAAMITRLDLHVGRLLATLDAHGLAANTLVLFTSDNGPHREGGNDPDFFDSNGPLRGIKRDLYEGGIRVPLIARWPGRIPAGSTSDHVGYNGDILATLAAAATPATPAAAATPAASGASAATGASASPRTGVMMPADRDSISLLPAMMGQPADQKSHDYLYWEFYERGSSQAVRLDNWKAVRAPMLTGEIELYDLATDLAESKNVAAAHPDVVSRIRAIMQAAHRPSPDWRVPSSKQAAELVHR